MNKLNKKGFTLVEILAVIVMLSILIVITTTKGFGAFDNTKTKISQENMNAIKKSANLLMTEVVNCDEKMYPELIKHFVGTGKDCEDLKDKASTKDGNGECLKIELQYMLDNDYISGSGIESISNYYPNFYINACIDGEKIELADEPVTGTKSETSTSASPTLGDLCENIEYEKNTLAYNIICDAKKVSNEQKELGYAEFGKTPITTPAVEISSENESELLETQDDYGTSYYYRGNVIDNYVEFNNMCWRIVRIEGDGSVKITLAAQKKCSEITDSDTGTAFIGNGDYGCDTNGYYFADYINGTNGMRSILNTWLDSSGIDKTKLKQDNWCIGNMRDAYHYRANDYQYAGKIVGTVSGMITSRLSFKYSNYNRLETNQTPSLKCETTGTDGEVDTNYIGALTADEIIYAGGKIYTSNQTYYLNKNATSNSWWSLSPSHFDVGGSAFNVNDDGYIDSFYVSTKIGVRPALSLKTGIEISNGDGTISNPYTIK